jgi:hypothetical protein
MWLEKIAVLLSASLASQKTQAPVRPARLFEAAKYVENKVEILKPHRFKYIRPPRKGYLSKEGFHLLHIVLNLLGDGLVSVLKIGLCGSYFGGRIA